VARAARTAPSAVTLLIGIVVLVWSAARPKQEALSWEGLLMPYSQGEPLPGGFRVADIRRGPWNDVLIAVDRPGDTAAIDVHVLPRGRWTSVRESHSFAIGYEIPRSSATDAEREAVTEALAQAIRARDRGLPPPDAIPLRAGGGAAVLAAWFEALRGWSGLLLGASLGTVGLLLVTRSPPASVAGLVLGLIDVAFGAAGLPTGLPPTSGAWLLPAAAVLLGFSLWRRTLQARGDWPAALAIVAAAVALRLVLGPWGPMHPNGYGAHFVAAAATDPGSLIAYGPGFVEVFGPFAALAPAAPDWAVFGANATCAAFLPLLAFLLARLMGLVRTAAVAVAVLIAVDPVAIRMGATESYFPAIIVLCTAAGVALVAARGELRAGAPWRAAAAMVGAGMLLAQAARIHPAAWVPVAVTPFIALTPLTVSPGRMRFSRRRAVSAEMPTVGGSDAHRTCAPTLGTSAPLAFLASAALTGGVLIATSGGALLDVFAGMSSGRLMQPMLPSPAPLAWVAAATMAYALLAPQRRLAVPAGIVLAAWLLTRHAYGQSWIAQSSYDRFYLTVLLVAAGALAPARLWRRRWLVGAAAVLLAAVWIRYGLPIVAERTTDHLEYRWLREQLAQLPPDCRVVHLASADKRALLLPTYVGTPARAAVAIDLRQPYSIDAALAPAPCLVYVRTSLCSSAEGRPACDTIEQRLDLTSIARASFPARPSRPYHE
jgi:hypothetical protein